MPSYKYVNYLWDDAKAASLDPVGRLVYRSNLLGSDQRITNTGGARLFRALQGVALARMVTASWDRLGVTNYVFHYSQICLCGPKYTVSATVRVMANQVVKVENARDAQGNAVENPSLALAPTISQLFDRWILDEPEGAQALRLEFDRHGFPTYIGIDPNPGVADEELNYVIESFTPLP